MSKHRTPLIWFAYCGLFECGHVPGGGVLLLVEDDHALDAADVHGVRGQSVARRFEEMSHLQRLARACQRLVHIAFELPLGAHPFLHRHPNRTVGRASESRRSRLFY